MSHEYLIIILIHIHQLTLDVLYLIPLQILVQHIKAVLPGLKSRISSTLVSVAKEHASYGEITESKACLITSAVQTTLVYIIVQLVVFVDCHEIIGFVF